MQVDMESISSMPTRKANASNQSLYSPGEPSAYHTNKHEYTTQQHAEHLQRQAFLQAQTPAEMFPIISESISRKPMIATNVIAAPLVRVNIFSLFIFILAYSVDHFAPNSLSATNFFQTFVEGDPEKMRVAVGATLRALSNIFSLLLTFSGVVLQLANNRYSAQATLLLFQDWYMLSAIALLLVTLLIQTIVLYSVVKIVKRIETHVHTATDERASTIEGIRKNQIKAIRGIDHLADIAKIEADKKGRNVAFSVLDSLLGYCLYYQEKKMRKHDNWFKIPPAIRSTPDFEFLPEEILEYYEKHRIWIEAKILRQFYSIFNDSLRAGRNEMCFIAVACTRRVAEAACKKLDIALLTLSITFFNTYMKFAIQAGNSRVAYQTMHLYRQLTESLLSHCYSKTNDLTEPHSELIENLVTDIHNIYYFNEALAAKNIYIAETIAHDQAALVEIAFFLEIHLHIHLLDSFLYPRWCENSSAISNIDTPNGVLKAKIKLATSYLCSGKIKSAKLIFNQLRNTPHQKLDIIWKDFISIKSPSYWEINDRGYNMDYLNEDQRKSLEQFFLWFEGFVPPKVPGDERDANPMLVWSAPSSPDLKYNLSNLMQ